MITKHNLRNIYQSIAGFLGFLIIGSGLKTAPAWFTILFSYIMPVVIGTVYITTPIKKFNAENVLFLATILVVYLGLYHTVRFLMEKAWKSIPETKEKKKKIDLVNGERLEVIFDKEDSENLKSVEVN